MRVTAATLGALASMLLATSAGATPFRFLEATGFKQLYGGFSNDVGGQWDSPVIGKRGDNLLDVIYLSGGPVDWCGTPSSSNFSPAGGCYGQCVELTARWMSHYVYADHSDENKTWIHGNGGSGFCGCARGQCGTGLDPNLFEVYDPGSGYVPVAGDVLSLTYVHAEVLLNSWVDGGGMHYGIAQQNVSAIGKENWLGDHIASEACIIHAVGMPTLARPPVYASDVDGDGRGDVCGRASDGVHCTLSGGRGFGDSITGPAWKDSDGWWLPRYDSTIQMPDVNGDGKADLCARDSQGIVCALSDGKGFSTTIRGPAWSDAAGWTNERNFETIRFPDLNGDGKADVCGRDGNGLTCALSNGAGFGAPVAGPAWSDANGWRASLYYSTIQFADVNGDGMQDACARGSGGISCALSDGKGGFGAAFDGPAWSDANGWGTAHYASTVQFGDLDGDGKADVCGRSSAGIVCARSTGAGFDKPIDGPAWSDANGWMAPRYYATIQMMDYTGDGKLDICGRDANGVVCAPWTGAGFGATVLGPAWSDANGFSDPSHHTTLSAMDLDGDGRADICARSSSGATCALSNGNGFDAPVAGPAWSDASGWRSLPYYGSIRWAGAAKIVTPATPPRTSPQSNGIGAPDTTSAAAPNGDPTIEVPGCTCTTANGSAPSPSSSISALVVVLALRSRRRREGTS